MAKILFIIPDKKLLPFARKALSADFPEIEVVAAVSREGIGLVRSRIGRGLEVVAARTVTAAAIREENLNIPVVEIPRTSFDIIRALEEAKSFGEKFAFIAYPEKIWGITLFAEAFGINLRQYTVSFKNDFEKEIIAARSDGADVILGGFSVVKTAKRLGIPCALIQIGEEALLQAAREATQIRDMIEIEAAKRGVFGTILDYSHDGIVTVDKDRRITDFNPAAEKICGVNRLVARGRPISEILPQVDLSGEGDAEDSAQHIHEINGSRVMFRRVPITVNKKSFGAVITFQEISKIQQMEALIRKEIYARGHIANFRFADILGDSPAILRAIRIARSYAATEINILILGETGTGKEVFAQSIHNASERSHGPFVAINCAALPTQILESELFGYVAGAFTGASKEGRPGLFEIAHGGTIFLDEIAEMDYVNQARLLRFLQEKTVVRLGSHKVIPVDVRVIAATNKNLETQVNERKFRDDLYFRLNVLNLELPPLRARREDIRLYAQAFLKEISTATNRSLKFAGNVAEVLDDYPWPGNIRELRNIVSRLAVTSETALISRAQVESVLSKAPSPAVIQPSRNDRIAEEIMSALQRSKGNYSAAAKLLGVHRLTLRRRMQKLGIDY